MVKDLFVNSLFVGAMVASLASPASNASATSDGWGIAKDLEHWATGQSPALAVTLIGNGIMLLSIRELWKRSLEEARYSRQQTERMVIAIENLKDALDSVEGFKCNLPKDGKS